MDFLQGLSLVESSKDVAYAEISLLLSCKHENYQVLDQCHLHGLSMCLGCEFSLMKYLRILSDCFSAVFRRSTHLVWSLSLDVCSAFHWGFLGFCSHWSACFMGICRRGGFLLAGARRHALAGLTGRGTLIEHPNAFVCSLCRSWSTNASSFSTILCEFRCAFSLTHTEYS